MQDHCITQSTSETTLGKVCTCCHVWKVLDAFNRKKTANDGRDWQCKECKYEKHRRYWQKHPEANKEKSRRAYAKQRDKWRERHKEYFLAHQDEMSENHRVVNASRKATQMGAEGSFTVEEFRALCEAKDWRCSYCGTKLTRRTVTVDHIVPITRMGHNDIVNIAPCCGLCNRRKRDRTPEEWLGAKTT